MCATALIGRVGDEDVPRSDRRRIGVMLEQRDHCRVERGEKGGDAVTLRQEITLRVGRYNCKPGGLVDERAPTGQGLSAEHLLAATDDGVLDNPDQYYIVVHVPSLNVSCLLWFIVKRDCKG